jgi:hypothetical protein
VRGRRLIAPPLGPTRARGASRSGLRGLALAVGILGGCASLPDLAEDERWEEIVARASARKRPPKGKAARAYAQALERLGRGEEARAVLVLDHRRGGDVRSLLALAALERRLGLSGAAAVHYSRAIDLDIQLTKTDPEACRLMRERAATFAAQGAGRAAEDDLRRADLVCVAPADPADPSDRARMGDLRQRVDAAAQAEAEALVRATRCSAPGCRERAAADRVADVHDAITKAAGEGPLALRAAAHELDVALSAEQIATLLRADLHAELGMAIVGDDEVRAWVGGQPWSELAPTLMTQDPATSAYAQLRLGVVVGDLPIAPRRAGAPAEADVWSAHAIEEAGDAAWRVLAWQGDLGSAELALGARWRPAAPKTEGAAPTPPATAPPEIAPEVPGVDAPMHWSARVDPDAAALPALLAVARLRHAAGRHDDALSITRYVLARAGTGRDVADEAAAEAAWHLAWGRPWQALAVATAVRGPATDHAAAAAASAILLTRAFCGGPCHEDEDLDVATRVMGEAWIESQRGELDARAMTGERPPARSKASAQDGADTRCAGLAELLAPDAKGFVPEALRAAARDLDSEETLALYARAFESDVTLACDSRWVMPLWAAVEGGTSADAVLERLAHGTQVEAPRTLAARARLGMIAGRSREAEQSAVAAGAASIEPRALWIDLMRFADATGRRDLELFAGREALLHTEALHDRELRRALLVERLHDLDRESADLTTPAGREGFGARLNEHFGELSPAQRWAEREAIAERLADEPWVDDDIRGTLQRLLWPSQELLDAHPIGRRRLAADPGVAAPPPYDAAALSLWSMGGKPVPASTRTFADPARMPALRRALARHAEPWTDRWRIAIGLAVFGRDSDRATAVATLLAMSEGDARAALVDVLVAGPAALAPGGRGGARGLGAPVQPVPLVANEEVLVRLVFGLPPGTFPEPEAPR